MKERPILFSAPMVRAILDGSKTQTRRIVKPQPSSRFALAGYSRVVDGLTIWGARCPYGVPGDHLWVRETLFNPTHEQTWTRRYHYVANGAPSPLFSDKDKPRSRPSIHMPRWASRITLEVTDVRVERLQDISRGDAMDEGCPFANMAAGPDPRHWYADIWNQLNGAGAWDANPWVWCVSFRRV